MSDKTIVSVKDVKLDDFVKFIGKDDRGKITYVGKVIGVQKDWITLDCFQGIIGFRVCKENDLVIDEKPMGWDKYSKDPEKFRRELKEKEKQKDFAPEVKTQKEFVFDFVKANKKQPRPKLLKMLTKEFPDSEEGILKSQMDLAFLKL